VVVPAGATPAPLLRVTDLSKVFVRGRQRTEALKGLDLDVREGEFLTLLGPSGCGKSTLLHLLGGFETPTAGRIVLDGRPVRGPGRDRGMVFQDSTLFPWWTVARNVGWPVVVGGGSRSAVRSRVDELLGLVGLADVADAYPAELSGGMRQRACIARTLALEPRVLLMDEPFGSLDAQTREVLQEELGHICEVAGTTVVFVTHDIHEAVFLGDRAAVMSARPGRLTEVVEIGLGRPRPPDTRKSPELLGYHNRLWDRLRAEAGRPQPQPSG